MSDYNDQVFRQEYEKAIKNDIYEIAIKKRKRFRSAFKTEQVDHLEKEFRKYPYISNARRKDVANVLNIPERAVKIWFQNRRMKEKKDTSKEPDDKTIEINEQINNVQSTNDCSLPILVQDGSSTDSNMEANDVINNTINTDKCTSYCKDISPEYENVATPTVIKNIPTSTTSSAEFSIELLKKYKAKSEIVDEEKPLRNISPQHNHQEKHNGEFNYVQNKTASQHLNYSPYLQASSEPQDLTKQNFQRNMPSQIPQANADVKCSSSDLPVYLKGFYAQPFLPPGDMIWKPTNLAPIISSPIPAVAIPNPGISHQQNVKRSCNCDCHLKPLVFFQQHNHNHSPNMQYMITAVPYQNPSNKF